MKRRGDGYFLVWNLMCPSTSANSVWSLPCSQHQAFLYLAQYSNNLPLASGSHSIALHCLQVLAEARQHNYVLRSHKSLGLLC